jgi:hypothetical protein
MPYTPPAMVPSLANSGYGTTFSVSASSPVTFVAVAEITMITKRNFSVPSINVTNLLSPNTTEELIPGITAPGTVDLEGNFIGDTTQLQFVTLAQAETVFYFQIKAPMQRSAKTLTSTGTCFVTTYETGPFDSTKKIDFKVTLQVTGAVQEVVA